MSVQVRSDVPGMRHVYNAIRAREFSADEKRKVKEYAKRGAALAAVQRSGGSGLYVDSYLRHFVSEYNGRLLQGEGMHMPSSFNVARAFLDPAEDAFVLKLLPQQENVISFSRMLDNITDPSVDTSLANSSTQMDELTIYEMNMLGGHAEFKIPGSAQYVFCGVGCCKDSGEITLMGVFGRENPNPVRSREKLDPLYLHPEKSFLKQHAEAADLSDQPLFGDEGYQPIILLARVDVEAGTVQSRMVLEELKDTFSVSTDDPEDITYVLNQKDDSSKIVAKMIQRIETYAPLFELLFAVPSCFPLMDGDDVGIERHPTGLRLDPTGMDAKSASILSVREAPRYVSVNTLYDLGSRKPGPRHIAPSNLKIETAGYWKALDLTKSGLDKVGNPIQGKTWVTSQKSWIENERVESLSPYDKPSTIEPLHDINDEGWLYVMRNASHGRDIYKIGFTTRSVEERAAQLSNTSGQPDFFNIVESWNVRSPRTIEHEVHEILKDYRVNRRREFFQLKYDKIRSVIRRVLDSAGAEI
ncbi:GIY-YIG nuclease family protein [Sphingomonas sp. DC1100-1]|uniref:GIY-YIG nuclease family protein n=1 Tax=unclassified Sphingomonas TaxID=196159 RepID=UPI003CEDFB77